jgi:hypothetical protein
MALPFSPLGTRDRVQGQAPASLQTTPFKTLLYRKFDGQQSGFTFRPDAQRCRAYERGFLNMRKEYLINKQIISAYGDMIKERIERGWDGYLISLMFNNIGGSKDTKIKVMQSEVERVYDNVARWSIRNYKKLIQRPKLPIWIVAPDFPVFKHQKMDLEDVTVNDGLHLHAMAAHHPHSRLKEKDLVEHFRLNQEHYVQRGCPLRRVHAERIVTNPGYVVGYGFKSVQKGRVKYDDAVMVLPTW